METGGTSVRLTGLEVVSETTRFFRFQRIDNRNVEYHPGQFFRFILRDDRGEFERSYSLCNLGEDVPSSAIDLIISEVRGGRATQVLFGASPGFECRISGPYGKLVLPDKLPENILMVCTSVGIAPFLPMLDEMFRRNKDRYSRVNVTLVFGIRNLKECLYRDYLQELAADNSRFEVAFCFSKALPEDACENDHKGYVQDWLEKSDNSANGRLVYLCGNPLMIDAVFSLLKSRGFTGRQVIREKYVFARDLPIAESAVLSKADKELLAEKIKKYQKKDE